MELLIIAGFVLLVILVVLVARSTRTIGRIGNEIAPASHPKPLPGPSEAVRKLVQAGDHNSALRLYCKETGTEPKRARGMIDILIMNQKKRRS